VRAQLTAAVVISFVLGASSSFADERLAIVDAAKRGDAAAVRALVEKKANVNTAAADGTTALHWASYHDDLETAELLIRAGAKVSAATDLGVTPLWTASQNTSAAMVRKLLEAGADPNIALLAGETPLMVAARAGSAGVVELLLARGAKPNARGTRGQTALMWAVAQKHPDVVSVLVKHADIHAKSDVWNEVMAVPPHGYLPYNRAIPHGGDTALLFAARVGDLASAKLLVAAGANVDDADAWGVSATALAAHAGFEPIVQFLLDNGADPNAAGAGFAPLHVAVMRRNQKMVRALLDYGADANAAITNWTPTRRSSKDYHFEPELVGATPFWLAARFTQPDVMRLLVEYGANPLIVHRVEFIAGESYRQRKEATTALMAAVGMGGSAPWVQPPRGAREALMIETAKLALELGVDVNAANVDGRTALDAAKTAKLESVVAFLVEHGAKPGSQPKASSPDQR
jgi:uncharacterized protein